MSNRFHTAMTFLYSIAILGGCASQSHHDFAPTPSGALGVISEEEVRSSNGTTALEVIERVHPSYLTSKLDLAPIAEREVYLNGVKLGGVDQLRWIPAREVKEIRFVRAIDGGAYGVGRSGGAIVVISRSGR